MRAIWSGTISFGLVSVPVRLYSATKSKELRFHFLHKDDLQPIGYGKHESVEETKKGRTRKETARKAS
jgi:DNA end-binding protein Ku